MAQNNNAAAHAAPKTSVKMSNLRAWLPRALMLGVIWGIAVFLWGTFGAWTRDQYVESELRLAESRADSIDNWLNQAISPLARLANDKRLAIGMELPAGVESLPVQRVLYEYAYLTGQTEVYIVDLLHQRVGHTAGATTLPQGVITRLADMDSSNHMLMGIGQRGGQMLLALKVDAPLPNKLIVMIPTSLATLATGQPDYYLPGTRKLSLIVPHTAGWAEWREGEQGFQLDEKLTTAMRHGTHSLADGTTMTVMTPLKGWPQVALGLQSPNKVSGTRLLPQLLVGLWALMMSAMVLWSSAPIQRKIMATAAPVLEPLGNVIGPVRQAFATIIDSIGNGWASANKEVPLISVSGAFDSDFNSAPELAKRMGMRRAKSSGKQLKLNQNATNRVARATNTKKITLTRNMQPMQWPDFEKPRAAPPKEEESNIDNEDIKAVIEDCLRKRRIKLLYQPIYRAGDNMPVMHEVYARLLRENGEIITPDIFMPVTIKHHLTLELDLVVLRKVVNEHFNAGASPMTPLALNISSTSLDGIAYLQEMASQGPRVLQKISFEVSSQEMIRDPKAMRLLKELQKHGGNLAVDYFGGGIAMLEASRAMGFNYVKMNCARLIGSDAGKKEIITLCKHARGIGLPIILEMVGDKESLEFSRRAGAEFLQGYALARPLDRLATQPLTPDLDGVKNLAVPTP